MNYKTINDIIAHNKYIGHHFFDKDSITHWNSRVYPKVYEGSYFITYECDKDSDDNIINEGYTIRQCVHGVIHSVSNFKQYETYEQAETNIRLHM